MTTAGARVHVIPADFARLVVERFEASRGPYRGITTTVALGMPARVGEVVNAVGGRRAHVKKTGLGTIAWRIPIGAATGCGEHQRAIGLRFLFEVRDGAAEFIDAIGPVERNE